MRIADFLKLLFQLQVFEKGDQLLEAFEFCGFGDVVLHTSMRVRSLAHRVGKHVRHIVSYKLHKAQGILVLLIRFAAEANDEVARNGDAWDHVSDLID